MLFKKHKRAALKDKLRGGITSADITPDEFRQLEPKLTELGLFEVKSTQTQVLHKQVMEQIPGIAAIPETLRLVRAQFGIDCHYSHHFFLEKLLENAGRLNVLNRRDLTDTVRALAQEEDMVSFSREERKFRGWMRENISHHDRTTYYQHMDQNIDRAVQYMHLVNRLGSIHARFGKSSLLPKKSFVHYITANAKGKDGVGSEIDMIWEMSQHDLVYNLVDIAVNALDQRTEAPRILRLLYDHRNQSGYTKWGGDDGANIRNVIMHLEHFEDNDLRGVKDIRELLSAQPKK